MIFEFFKFFYLFLVCFYEEKSPMDEQKRLYKDLCIVILFFYFEVIRTDSPVVLSNIIYFHIYDISEIFLLSINNFLKFF